MVGFKSGSKLLIVACALWLPWAGYAGTGGYTVGGDGACNFSSIQDAIDNAVLFGAPPTTIKIARSQNYSAIALDLSAGWVVLSGGYDDCADDTPTGRTVLNGAGGTADAVIDIAGNAWVQLRNLAITGGDPSAGNYGGGIQILGDNSVWLENTIVHGNQSDRGGGVYIDGALIVRGFLSIDQDSSIFSNIANHSGGGIYCVDVGDRPQLITLTGDIYDNQAVNGGGVYLDGCYAGQEPTKSGDGIFFNRATGSGGGAYLTNNGVLIMRGLPGALSVLSLNDASLDGGALYLTGGSVVRVVATQLIDNFAGRDGGAIYLDSGLMTLDPGRGCTLQRCSRLESNRALGRGGAIYQVGGDLEILGTWVMDNQAPDGSVIKTEGGTSYFESILAAGNRDATAVMRIKNTDAEIYNSTFAGNMDMNATLLLTGGSLTLKGSIIWEASGNALDFFGAATTTSYDCLLVHNFPALITRITFSDPLFVNPANDNYHLQMGSPAIDYCVDILPYTAKGTPALGPGHDIEGEAQGNDIATIPNEYGPHDLGADEWYDSIFSNGFERIF